METENFDSKSKSCPECKKMLLQIVDFIGQGVDIKMKCAYCGKRMLVQVGQKLTINATHITVAIFVFISAIQAFVLFEVGKSVAFVFTNYLIPLP